MRGGVGEGVAWRKRRRRRISKRRRRKTVIMRDRDGRVWKGEDEQRKAGK